MLEPFFAEQKSTKYKILSSLSSESNHSAKRIHRKIQQDDQKTISYQAVYKLLKQLEEEQVLQKIGDGYRVNPFFIHTLEKLVENLKEHQKQDQQTTPQPQQSHYLFRRG